MRFLVLALMALSAFGQTRVIYNPLSPPFTVSLVPGLTNATFASPPSSPQTNHAYLFTDASATGTCTGGGSAFAVCVYNGSTYVAVAGTSTGLGDPGANSVVYRNGSGTSIPATATQMSAPNFCTDAVGTDAYACNLSPVIASYASGTLYWFVAGTANTGAASINFNSKGALTIKKMIGGITTDLATGDIAAGQLVGGFYDGTNFQMATQLGTAVDTTSTQTLTNKTVDGVTPTVMGYNDATSSIQTQLNTKGTGNVAAKVATTFSATPTFTCPSSTFGTIVTFTLSTALTTNVTSSTLASCTSGSILNFILVQDGTGSRTFAWPTGFSQACPVSATASDTTLFSAEWDGTTANYISCHYVNGPGACPEVAAPGSNPASGYQYNWCDSTLGAPRIRNSAGTFFAFSKELTSGNIRKAGGANAADSAAAASDIYALWSSTGFLRNSGSAAGEISGDCTTSTFTITCQKVNGIAYSATAAAHSVEVVTTANTTATAKTLPDCTDTGGNHLNFTQSTDAFSCGTSGGGGGSGTAGSNLFSTTGSTTVTAASATTLIGTVSGSTTIAANTFTAGAVMQIQAQGYYTGFSTRTLTIDLKIGGTTRLTTGAIAVPVATNGVWRLFCDITTRTAGASGTQIGNCIFETTGATLTAPGEGPMQTSSTWTVDTTGTLAVDLQATWDSTTGSPTITSTNVAAWIPGAPVTSVGGNTGAVTLTGANGVAVSGVAITGSNTIRAVTGTTDTLLTGDCGNTVTLSNAATTGAVTVPQAGSTGFAAGCKIRVKNIDPTFVGIWVFTTTTSVFHGTAQTARFFLLPNATVELDSDGTDWDVDTRNNNRVCSLWSTATGDTLSTDGATYSTFTSTNASTNATDFAKTCTIPANMITTGTSIRVTTDFRFTTSGTPTRLFSLKAGSTAIFTGTAAASTNALTLLQSSVAYILIGTAAPGGTSKVDASLILGVQAPDNSQRNTLSPVAVATNAAFALTLTNTFGASTAGNMLQLAGLVVEIISW